MDDKKREEVIENMIKLRESLREELSKNNQEIEDIGYYRDFKFTGTYLGINDAYIVKIKDDSIPENDINHREEDEKGIEYLYQIYDKNNNLIASIDKEGKVQFKPKYLEGINKSLLKTLKLEDAEFVLPEENGRDDIVLTRKAIDENKIKLSKGKEKNEELEETEPIKKEEDNSQEKEIAEKKGIPINNVLVLRPDSNFYYDHPEVEGNLYFYKDNDGIVRAEYIDENGNSQPSNYFEASTTELREQTVDMGDDGIPVVKQVPYQTMLTKNLNNVDKDIREIRINIDIDTYGYLEISEAREGTNGKWVSHDIEVMGRDYNSNTLNRMTSIYTRKAEPNKQTEAYDKVESTELAEDGVNLSEMFLIEHAQEFIQRFIREGYNKDEATQIFNLMIGEEKLQESQAKKEVNEKIKEQNTKEDEEKTQEDDDEGRTPWGDAEAREARARR